MKSLSKVNWFQKLTDAPAIVAFAAGVVLTVIVLGVVLFLLNQSVELI